MANQHCTPSAGTPATNATFFCESISGNCFLLRTGTTVVLGFYEAADTCSAYVGGNLVVYDSRGKQMLVSCAPGLPACLPNIQSTQQTNFDGHHC